MERREEEELLVLWFRSRKTLYL